MDIDLLDRDRFAESIPHEWFTWLREHDPVHFHEEPGGPGFWVVSRHADIISVNRDAASYSSDALRGGVVVIEEEMAARAKEAASAGGKLMLELDPPDHTRYRKLVNRGFTPRMIGEMELHIRELTNGILDRAVAAGEGDFVVDVAAELPLEVIAELIGVPHEDRHKIFEWSNRMIGSEDPEYRVSDEEIAAAQIEMFMYAQQLAEQRRESPSDDIISALLSADVDGESLSDMDFNLFFLLLSVAGNETTRNAISHGMNAFLEHPGQWAAYRSDPEGHQVGATEEILRWASPVMFFRRNVTRDVQLQDRRLHEGDKITLWYISGNRDEGVFTDPFEFDITRSPNPHIAFGGGGPHFCLGASLARLEVRVLLEELLDRCAGVEAAGEVQHLRSNFLNGIKHLPLRLRPA